MSRCFLLILLALQARLRAQPDVSGIIDVPVVEEWIQPSVTAVLEANPKTTPACSRLTFNGAKSFDARGDPVQFFWWFGPGTPMRLRTADLAQVLEGATKSSATRVEIPPDVLSEAAARVGDTLGEGDARVEVRLTIRNDWGNFSEALASAGVVGSISQAEPVVTSDGPTAVSLQHYEGVTFAVKTAEAGFALNCAKRGASTSAGRVLVSWEYKQLGNKEWFPLLMADEAPTTTTTTSSTTSTTSTTTTTTEADEDDNSTEEESEVVPPPPRVPKVRPPMPRKNPILRDLAVQPNVVRLAPHTFWPGSKYLIRAVASFDDAPTLAPKSSVTFRVSVEDWPQPNVVVIGPSIASSMCDFELDASNSWDPAHGDDGHGAEGAGFLFKWTCFPIGQVGAHDFCHDIENFQAANAGLTDGSGASGAKLKIQGTQLPQGAYRFTVVVTRRSGQGQGAAAVHSVEVIEGAFTPLVPIFPSYGQTARVNAADGVPEVVARITPDGEAGAGCVAPEQVWRWALVLDGSRQFLHAMLPTKRTELGNGAVEIRAEAVPDFALIPGGTYFHILLQAAGAETFRELEEGVNETNRPPFDTVLVTDGPIVMAVKVPPFLADRAPQGGKVTVTPRFFGHALRTIFTVNTYLWSDEKPAELNYAFYAFPIPDKQEWIMCNGSNLTEDMPLENCSNMSIVYSEDDLTPKIDWDDESSDHYWVERGGRLVSSWGRSPQASLHAAAGRHLLVACARDIWGTVTTAFAETPLVVAPVHNLTSEDVLALIARVEATNDPNQFLEAAHAIASTVEDALKERPEMICSEDQFERVTCVKDTLGDEVGRAVLGLLVTVPEIMDVSLDIVAKLMLAVEATLQGATEPATFVVDVSAVFGESLRPLDGQSNESNASNLSNITDEEVYQTLMEIPGFNMSVEVAQLAQDVIRKTKKRVLDAQASGYVGPLNHRSAVAVLGCVAWMMGSLQHSGLPLTEGASVGPKVLSLVDDLSEASFAGLPAGEEILLQAELPKGIGLELLMTKVDVSGAGANVNTRQLMVPRKVAAVPGRRLQDGPCTELEIRQTFWKEINPHFWAPPGFGQTGLILPNASIQAVSLSHCGQPLLVEDLTQPLEITLDLTPPLGLNPGFWVSFMCARFDTGLGAWTTEGLSTKETVTNTSTKMICLSSWSHGHFVALYKVEEVVPPNTTTPVPPLEVKDEGLSTGAIAGIAIGAAVFCCCCTIGGFVLYRITHPPKVEPAPEKIEEEPESESEEEESVISEPPDLDPALTALRRAAEAGKVSAKDILQYHSDNKGVIRPELIASLDAATENRRREAKMKVSRNREEKLRKDAEDADEMADRFRDFPLEENRVRSAEAQAQFRREALERKGKTDAAWQAIAENPGAESSQALVPMMGSVGAPPERSRKRDESPFPPVTVKAKMRPKAKAKPSKDTSPSGGSRDPKVQKFQPTIRRGGAGTGRR
eukprot:TRINITY_DN47189_c0_g1_i1.p1 TRINITY_DN47189_c0_g1~~TRINITY_DN47189_c0_g1_i1.p1  ORF type:complete len:1458 (+),score=331.20 TRINITY_DN47189_c0_g1_i1:137-4510(+)